VVQARLSKRTIDALKPKAKPYVVFDGELSLPGFGVRVMPSGFKSFFLSYRPKGRDGLARRDAPKMRCAIGPYGPVTADHAGYGLAPTRRPSNRAVGAPSRSRS
jgi:Arm DNA-binding domain